MTQRGATPAGGIALEVEELDVWYGDAIHALRGVNFSVPEGSLVALLGANGAGKSTLLRTITGLLSYHEGALRGGRVLVKGEVVSGLAPASIVKRGVSQVMEGRRVFSDLTVRENLLAGGYTTRGRKRAAETYERVLEQFPVLRNRSNSAAGYLSGGEQQMLAIGRALMQEPDVLLLDEPSLGLAPIMVNQVFDLIKDLNRQGTSIVVIEQNVALALQAADYAYVLERGRIVQQGRSEDLLSDDAVSAAYLGANRTTPGQPPDNRPEQSLEGGSR